MTDTPPLAEEEDSFTVAAEREILEGFLDYHRTALSGKLRGLSEEDARHDQLGQVSLRFIYVNILAEYARHAGHADIIREQIDGATGD